MKRKLAGSFLLGLLIGGAACIVVLKHTDRLMQGAAVVHQNEKFVTILFNHDPSNQTVYARFPVIRFADGGGQKVSVAISGHQWPEWDDQTSELMQSNAFDVERKYLSEWSRIGTDLRD